MSVDPASFRKALGQFATGVTVVTTRDGSGHPLGWVGEVRSLAAHPGRPLLHHGGAYGRIAGGGRSGKAGGDRL